MNKDWDIAIAFVLKMEGNYTLDPNDPGGETKFGISHKAYPNLDIGNLTEEQAKAIYLRDYWQPCQCDQLPTAFAISVFDTAVNQGVGKAKRLLQIALDVTVDGVIGDKTISSAFKANKYQAKKFLAGRLAEYIRLISANPSLMVFAVNWSYRVISLAEIVLKDSNNGGENVGA
jgi:lysozyme family protein